ncbi:uncharacterized protein TNCT_218301 [Trichonephila clavata]|nr:uncharacterized protein TNCT_502692 [Trichonephila clavata]GFR11933.1 uncharacterized protein TNCT_218301 [Trichonephila clavata]
MFGVELAAIVEASTEEIAKAEDKKAEKTSLKEEATKEVRENVEMKVDEREKPKVPVSLFEVSPGFVRPVPLSKPELDLLPKPIMPKEVIKEEIREIKETKVKVEEEKKAKPAEPKVAVCPPATKTATGTKQEQIKHSYGCKSNWGSDRNSSTYVSTPNQPTPGSVSNGKASNTQGSVVLNKDASEQSAENPVPNGKALEQSNQASGSAIEKSAFNIGAKKQSVERLDFTVGFWDGAENEPKQSSVNDAQENPKSKFTDVLKERAARGNGGNMHSGNDKKGFDAEKWKRENPGPGGGKLLSVEKERFDDHRDTARKIEERKRQSKQSGSSMKR